MTRICIVFTLFCAAAAHADPKEVLIAALGRSWALNKILAYEQDQKEKSNRSSTNYINDAFSLENFVKAAGQVDAAKEFYESCAAFKPDQLPYGQDVGLYSAYEVNKYCQRAKSPRASLVAALHTRLAWHEEHFDGVAQSLVRDTKKGRSSANRQKQDPVGEVEALRAEYQPAFDALGEPFPKKFFDNYLAAYKAAGIGLKTATNQSLFTEATEQNGPIDAVARRIAKTVPVKGAAFMASRTWPGTNVEKNGLGVPLYKYRTVRVVVKLPAESFCRAYDVLARADHTGGGRYGSWYFRAGDGLENDFDDRAFDRGRCP